MTSETQKEREKNKKKNGKQKSKQTPKQSERKEAANEKENNVTSSQSVANNTLAAFLSNLIELKLFCNTNTVCTVCSVYCVVYVSRYLIITIIKHIYNGSSGAIGRISVEIEAISDISEHRTICTKRICVCIAYRKSIKHRF